MKYYNPLNSRISIFLLLIFPVVFILFSCGSPSGEELPSYGWFEFVIPDFDTTQTAVDMSFLNEQEAGQEGPVTIKEGHFVNGKGDPIRFLGTNLTFSSAFPDKETSQKIAGRLSKLGCNVVRFHHMDMRPSPAGIWDENLASFDSGQVDKLDWLIYQLKKRGIYSNLNLHVSRSYPGLEDFEYEGRLFQFGKSIDQFYRPYIELQKDYARDLLTHRNPYTGTTYLEEPAIAFVEVNNENSLLSNWSYLPQLKGDHRAELEQKWENWLLAREKKADDQDVFWISRNYDTLATSGQKEIFWNFLVETEMAYAKEMTDFLRNDLSVKALVSETQASYSGVAGILREVEYADFIDVHSYWEHPRFPGSAWSRTDWNIRNSSMVTDRNVGTLDRFAMHRVAGMPLTISEYDHPAPSSFCAEMYPLLNSMAAFQNWDGIYHFTFDGPWDEGYFRGFFSSSGHPLKQIFLPVGAAIFRMGAVKSGSQVVQMNLPRKAVLEQLVESGDRLRLHGSNMDQVWKKLGAPTALPMLRPMEVVVGGEVLGLNKSIEEPSGAWVSETGELTWDNRDSLQAVYTINAPAAKAAVGYIGGKKVVLGDVTIAMDTTEFNWASIALVTLDGEAISTSSKMLLVAAGRVENTNMGWNQERNSVSDQWGEAPTMAEGIPATIVFRNMDKLKVLALDPSGDPAQELKVSSSGGELSVKIGAQYKTLWYLLER